MKELTKSYITQLLIEAEVLNGEQALEICRAMNAYNGFYQDELFTFDVEDLNSIFEKRVEDLFWAVRNGHVDYIGEDSLLRFNAYGNLESISEYRLQNECLNYYINDLTIDDLEYIEDDYTLDLDDEQIESFNMYLHEELINNPEDIINYIKDNDL